MKPFAYTAPSSVDAVVEALRAAQPGTKILAGGTTLYDLMKLGVEAPSAVIDVHRLPELTGISVTDSELVLGAGVRMADVSDHPVIRPSYTALAESIWRAASQQLRNMATLGGNLLQRTRCGYFRDADMPCNKRNPGSGCAAMEGVDRPHALLGASSLCSATYAGDFAIALLAFDAAVDVVGPRGERSIPLAELHVEPGEDPRREHVLDVDELIVRIRVPLTEAGRGSTYLKIRDRESYAFALASAAVGLVIDGSGIVTESRIALGGVATRPWRAVEAEQSLLGQPLTAAAARRAGEIAFAAARPGRTNEFRIELGIRTVADAVRTAGERAVR